MNDTSPEGKQNIKIQSDVPLGPSSSLIQVTTQG